MEKVPESIADHLWPSCTASMETKESEYQGFKVVTRLALVHRDNPVTIVYTYGLDENQPDITASGLYRASNRDVQMILPVLTRLRSFVGKQRVRFAYDAAFKQIEAGEDPVTVKKEFLAEMGGSSDAFYQAMYRRRKEKETNE